MAETEPGTPPRRARGNTGEEGRRQPAKRLSHQPRGEELPISHLARVVVYSAAGCGLCAAAIETVREVQGELGFELDVVDIEGDDVLESSYRKWLPVVEIDGERVFSHFVDEAALRERLA